MKTKINYQNGSSINVMPEFINNNIKYAIRDAEGLFVFDSIEEAIYYGLFESINLGTICLFQNGHDIPIIKSTVEYKLVQEATNKICKEVSYNILL